MLFKQYGTSLSPSPSSSTQHWGEGMGGLVDGKGGGGGFYQDVTGYIETETEIDTEREIKESR